MNSATAAFDFTVLVGMSATEVAMRPDLARLSRTLGASLAFLQHSSPTLNSELHRLSDLGARRVVVVGFGKSRLGPGVSWLRRIADAWWRDRGGDMQIHTANRLLRSVPEAEVRWEESVAGARPVTGSSAPLQSPAWETVPRHRHQVLICRGPRCSAAGAELTHEALVLALMKAGLGDDDALLTTTGCQFPCNQAPVVAVQPDDVWYGSVRPDRVDEIVATHLQEGRPVEHARLPRRPSGGPLGSDGSER